MNSMDVFVGGDLRIEAVDAPPDGPTVLRWLGKSGERYPSKRLDPYFKGLLGASAARGVTMRFEKLDYMNSATVTALIQLIAAAREAKVKLAFVYDPNKKWQKLSFEALRVFEKPDDLFRLKAT